MGFIMKRAIINALTDEITFKDLSKEENEIFKSEIEQREKDYLVNKQAEEAKKAAKQSALDKLAALGLTPEEISAITGA
jgi:phenylalanine-4-hydroxylase